jgi:hypothetical protein
MHNRVGGGLWVDQAAADDGGKRAGEIIGQHSAAGACSCQQAGLHGAAPFVPDQHGDQDKACAGLN